MPMYDFRCQACEYVFESLVYSTFPPICPICASWTEKIWTRPPTVIPDDVPGGFVIENLDRHPRTFYTKSSYRDELRARGLQIRDQHVGLPGEGSDKSPHTSRWI